MKRLTGATSALLAITLAVTVAGCATKDAEHAPTSTHAQTRLSCMTDADLQAWYREQMNAAESADDIAQADAEWQRRLDACVR